MIFSFNRLNFTVPPHTHTQHTVKQQLIPISKTFPVFCFCFLILNIMSFVFVNSLVILVFLALTQPEQNKKKTLCDLDIGF